MSSNEKLKKELGARVQRARRDLGLTQEELAARIGVTQGVVSNLENGVSTLDVPDLPRWARALEKPVMYFYLSSELDIRERALTVLGMFPEDRLDFVLHMLENMAITIQERGE